MRSNTANLTTTPLPANMPAAARTVLSLLRRLEVGSLTVQLPDGSVQRFGQQEQPHAP